MIHAYDKLYLSVAQKNLACMLELKLHMKYYRKQGNQSRNKPPLILTIAALNIGQAGRWPIISGVPVCLLRK